jgi:hypothetical protein
MWHASVGALKRSGLSALAGSIQPGRQRACTTDTAGLIKALEGHEFDGLKESKSTFRAWDHQHVQDVLVGQ